MRMRKTVLMASIAGILLVVSTISQISYGVTILSGPIGHNGHDYYLLDNSNWTDAEAQAVSMGGHLTSIGDQSENDWVWDTFSNGGARSLWIGLVDIDQDDNFVWTNGEPVIYTNWQIDQPTGGEYYTQMRYGQAHTSEPAGRWNDLHNTSIWDSRGIHGVVEIVPEPTLLTFLALGGLALIKRKRK